MSTSNRSRIDPGPLFLSFSFSLPYLSERLREPRRRPLRAVFSRFPAVVSRRCPEVLPSTPPYCGAAACGSRQKDVGTSPGRPHYPNPKQAIVLGLPSAREAPQALVARPRAAASHLRRCRPRFSSDPKHTLTDAAIWEGNVVAKSCAASPSRRPPGVFGRTQGRGRPFVQEPHRRSGLRWCSRYRA